jgi:hypothetical protein
MRHLLIFVATIFVTLLSFGQTLKRQDNETAEMFVKRLMPDTFELAHPVIETNTWDTTSKAIITFYGYDDPKDINGGYNVIFGHVYLPTRENNYRDISFGPIKEDSGYPEIISVFFANADKDKRKELVILCKYDQRHYDYNGEEYETFIFDNPTEQKTKLTYLEAISNKFFGCDCGWRTGKTEKAKYKTAKEVIAGLKKMGY